MFRMNCIILIFFVMLTRIESMTGNGIFKYNKVKSLLGAKVIREVKCSKLTAPVLNDILGAAFNERYMSVTEPPPFDKSNNYGKRDTGLKPFFVEDTYAVELSDKPAWEVTHLSDLEKENSQRADEQNVDSTRVKRANNRRKNDDTKHQSTPWTCESEIKWLDLGEDYYPRYLRTVECIRSACWYNIFTCQPRSFTVKVLRRRRGECVQTNNNIGSDGLHGDLKEMWIWEERAVNFCCDCVATKSSYDTLN